MRIYLMIFCFLLSFGLHAHQYVFVSFSMPAPLLEQTLKESSRLNIPAVLNGLYQNSMPATAQKIMELNHQIPNVKLIIDPTLFERFSIQQVPAVVSSNNQCFDVIYGNLTIARALQIIEEKGECRRSEL